MKQIVDRMECTFWFFLARRFNHKTVEQLQQHFQHEVESLYLYTIITFAETLKLVCVFI